MEERVARNLREAVRFNVLPIIKMYRINDDIAVVFKDKTTTDNIISESMCSNIIRCKYSSRYIGPVKSCKYARKDPNNHSCSETLTSYYNPSLYMTKYLSKLWGKGRKL